MPSPLFSPFVGEAFDQPSLPAEGNLVARNRWLNTPPYDPLGHLAPIDPLLMADSGPTSISFPVVPMPIDHFVALIMAYLQGRTPQSISVWCELMAYRLVKAYHCKNTNSSSEHEFIISELVNEHMNKVVLRTDRHIGARKHSSSSSSLTSSLIDGGLSPISSLPASSPSSDQYPANDTITRIQVPPHPNEALRTIEFNGDRSLRPSLWDIMILVLAVHKDSTFYTIYARQCYWFADSIFGCLEKWAAIHKNGIVMHRASTGRLGVVPVHSRNPEDIARIWANFIQDLRVMTQQKDESERARTEEAETLLSLEKRLEVLVLERAQIERESKEIERQLRKEGEEKERRHQEERRLLEQELAKFKQLQQNRGLQINASVTGRRDNSTASSGSSLTATNPTPIIILTLSPSPAHSSSSSPFVITPPSRLDTTPCTASLISNPSLAWLFRTPASPFVDSALSLTSTRPAPRPPAIWSRFFLGHLMRLRNQFRLAIEMDPIPASNLLTLNLFTTESSSTPTAAAIPASAAPATTPTPAWTSYPLITIRDYAFVPTDDRFHGRGRFVPKFNRLPLLNASLARGLYEFGRDDAKQKEREKKKKKYTTRNTWDMDAEHAVDDEEEVDRALPSPSFGPAGGWGTLGFGMDWLASSTHFSCDGFGGGGRGKAMSYLIQMDLAHNFGRGAYCGEGDADDGEEPPYLFNRDYSDLDHQPVVDSPLPPGSYRALYVFEAVGDAEMGLEEGQIVTVAGKERGDGWAVVNDTREGKEGRHALVPKGYLELVQLAD